VSDKSPDQAGQRPQVLSNAGKISAKGQHMKKVLVLSTLIPALLSPTLCLSSDEVKNGFSGEISSGLIFISNANNLNPSGSKKVLSTLGSSPERQLSTIPILLPEMTYRFGGASQFAWYFNTAAPIEEAGEFALSSGFAYHRPGLAYFETGLFFVPFAEVWENPYLLNQTRRETDVTTWGAQFAINRLFDSELRLKFAYLSEDVDNDSLATLFPDLARDGEIYGLSVSYELFSGSNFPVRPRMSLNKGEYDGESSSFVKVKTEISGVYTAGRYSLMPSLYYSYREHDDQDPVFRATRSENGYGANLAVKYDGLFGIESVALLALVGYSRGEASESFYDTESLVCGLGLTYRF
jgi:hypothetical protein